jgi:hypothetical protein
MKRCQLGQLDTPGGEKGAAADQESVGSIARRTCEDHYDLAAGVGVVNLDLQAHSAQPPARLT